MTHTVHTFFNKHKRGEGTNPLFYWFFTHAHREKLELTENKYNHRTIFLTLNNITISLISTLCTNYFIPSF